MYSVVIPSGVTSIGYCAFCGNSNLTAAYFLGSPPIIDPTAFDTGTNTVVYYMPGSTGWSSTFGGRIALLWNLRVSSPVINENGFGFAITGTSGLTVVVEATEDLAKPVWLPISTNTLTAGSSAFSDPAWKGYLARWYRFRSL